MAIPRDSRNLDATVIQAAYVRPGMSLVFDLGQGRQLFQVEKTGFSFKTLDDGTRENKVTLTSGPVADGGPPWVIELTPHAQVVQILGVAAA